MLPPGAGNIGVQQGLGYRFLNDGSGVSGDGSGGADTQFASGKITFETLEGGDIEVLSLHIRGVDYSSDCVLHDSSS
jgi:hypothetical protein